KEAPPTRAKTCALFLPKMCVAALVQLVVGIAHRLRPRLAEHHLKVDRLQALIHIAVDHAGRAGDAFPRPELDVDASSAFVLDEGGESALQHEEHFFHLVRMRRVPQIGRASCRERVYVAVLVASWSSNESGA